MPDTRGDRSGAGAPGAVSRTLVGFAALFGAALPSVALSHAVPENSGTSSRADPSRAPRGLPVPPVPGPTRGDLLALTGSTSKLSPWAASNLTSLAAAATVAGNLAVATTEDGAVEVVGRTATGHLELFTSRTGPRGFVASDLTELAGAPTAAGDPDVVVDAAGVTRVFFRTTTGNLEEVENDRHSGADPWFSSDLSTLTASTRSPAITGDPVAVDVPGAPLSVFARAAGGALVGFDLTTIALHPWYYEDVSGLAGGLPIEGTPAAAPAPDGDGLTCVYATSTSGTLEQFCDDDANWRLWSLQDVSGSLSLPPLTSAPSVLATSPLRVAVVTSAGHLLVVSVPADDLAGDSVRDLSASVRQRLLDSATPSIAADGAGYAVAGESLVRHVEVFDVAGLSSTAKVSVTDATMQLRTEQVAQSFPVAADAFGGTAVFVVSGGFIGLPARIVLAAESQDQLHAAVVDTPSSSDCNPFTAAFDRGTTTGCAPGTASEEWCSDFSDWVWTVAGVATTGIDGASSSFVTWGRARHQFLAGIGATPAVGDAVVWGVLNPLWGAHVGIVVGVRGKQIDVVSGNSGGYRDTSGVWDSGYFVPSTQTAQGDPIIGYVSPTPLG